MPYLSRNKKRQYAHILEVYRSVKQLDVPDSYIVRVIFPKHRIHISYRQWVRIKGMKPSQLTMDN
jgi:hypothetical protein